MNWVRVFNRLFEIINSQGECYFSGGRFISCVREVDPYFPDYYQYIEQIRAQGKSTSRKDYFYDILLSFEEHDKVRLLNAILDKVKDHVPEKVAEIRSELGGVAAVPRPSIHEEVWNAERLNNFLEEIDFSISSTKYERAVTLAYTCLEGFLKAFLKQNLPNEKTPKEILDLSKLVRRYLKGHIASYPDEALNMLNHVAHTVDRARNRYSESHFDEQAGRWLAVFIRDIVNSEIRLLLHFMKN